jgi:hypothetical protein
MSFLALLLMAAADDPADTLAKRMLPIYLKEADEYSIAIESAPKKALELKREPVFEWSNPTRNGGQQGVVFLWLRDGRPAAVGCIFSSPESVVKSPGARRIEHELHALDPEKLVVTRDALNQWKPQEGLARQELPDAPAPADTTAARKLQMGRLAEGFTGHTIDTARKERFELRVLPSPLNRYPAAKVEPVPKAPGEATKTTGVIDGALFALVSEAGTDPEVLLLVEAREEKGKARWEYALGKFSDCEIHVSLKGKDGKGKEVFSSIPSEENPYRHNPKHTYRTYQDKIVGADGKLLARIRQDEKGSHVVPVEK